MEVQSSINHHIAIKTTRFFMRMMGMWYVETRGDKIRANISLTLVILLMTTVLIAQSMDFYYRLSDFEELTTAMPAIAVGLSECFKFCLSLYQRERIINLNIYTEINFWKVKYNTHDLAILNDCNRKIISLYPLYIIILYVVPIQYMTMPLKEYFLSNGTIRTLPFTLYFGVEWSKTPVYQIAYVEEILAAYGVSLCAMTSASFLFTINIYAAGQFKILQDQFSSLCEYSYFNNPSMVDFKLNKCIRKHQILLDYVGEIENLYNKVILCQAMGTVISLCFSGFGVVMNFRKSMQRTILNIQFVVGSIIQLLLFSLSCHTIIEESDAIGKATYDALWYNISNSSKKNGICRSLQIIMIRTTRPCVITVGKFSPMSLNTFAGVLKTAMSYFTVLQTVNDSE
ncbi:odorant receptor 67c-like [Chelonus insularis]|uniref:odorant receptor 67c-like n=1 Tax=Chelonus insularis TaxID=460826 RepID=UPI00158CC111|nr:odorant receptor 67c-like [Chelonus insularis]